jgi:hypothetical protein
MGDGYVHFGITNLVNIYIAALVFVGVRNLLLDLVIPVLYLPYSYRKGFDVAGVMRSHFIWKG